VIAFRLSFQAKQGNIDHITSISRAFTTSDQIASPSYTMKNLVQVDEIIG